MTLKKSKEKMTVYCFSPKGLKKTKELSGEQKIFLKNAGFKANLGDFISFMGESGEIEKHVFGLGEENETPNLNFSLLAKKLSLLGAKDNEFKLMGDFENPNMAALGFLLGTYNFIDYKSSSKNKKKLKLSPLKNADIKEVERLAKAAFIARDLINTAPNDLDPQSFEKQVYQFAKKQKMEFSSIIGDELLKQNFPMVHAVGKASSVAPRLLDLKWGNEKHPKITLVGKGVTFDSGGLSIKHAAGMLLMKKDMGGAANVLGLAHAIIDAKLKIRLRVILPIVENAISGNSFRPGDILPSRNGRYVEIGNTDAEGRLILADALSLASEEKTQMIFNMATLTGAARVALGTELVPLYCEDKKLVDELYQAANKWDDPLWSMPFYQPYNKLLKSKIADVNHISSGGYAGSITAALFLQKFVKNTDYFTHLDIYGWSVDGRAGRSFGGTDQGIRAIYEVLKNRYK